MFLRQRRAAPSLLSDKRTEPLGLGTALGRFSTTGTRAACPGSLGGRSYKASAASLKLGIPSTVVAPLDLRWSPCARPHSTQLTLTLTLRPDLSQARELPPGMSQGAELTEWAVVG